MKHFYIIIILIASSIGFSQEAVLAPLPDKIGSLERLVKVDHFPPIVHVSTDVDRPGEFFWKHTTSILATETVEIVEFGAYIYYNDQWNLRATYGPKEFKKWFDKSKATIKAGQPYTYPNNWRAQTEIFAGWAMWYFIVKDERGLLSCGYKKLYTSDEMLTQRNIH